MGGKIAKILKQPATKEILRNVGSDAASKGTELLLRKIRGNSDIQSKLDERMQKAKRHISNTVDNAMKKKSRGDNIRYYNKIYDITTYYTLGRVNLNFFRRGLQGR